jgi:hypothetical protein
MIQTQTVIQAIKGELKSTRSRTSSSWNFSHSDKLASLDPEPRTMRPLLLSVDESSSVNAAKVSRLTLDSTLLKRAMYCSTSTALASWPRYSRNLGDS